ncbi:hypothetical protein ACPA9J_03670 [Pseudomonas aeruginosa]
MPALKDFPHEPRASLASPSASACSARSDPEFARWARGHGPITHNDLTQLRVHDLAQVLVAEGKASDTTAVYRTLWSADRLAVAGMWLTVQ